MYQNAMTCMGFLFAEGYIFINIFITVYSFIKLHRIVFLSNGILKKSMAVVFIVNNPEKSR